MINSPGTLSIDNCLKGYHGGYIGSVQQQCTSIGSYPNRAQYLLLQKVNQLRVFIAPPPPQSVQSLPLYPLQ